MIIKVIPPSNGDRIVVHQLPEPDMVVDPRPIGFCLNIYHIETSVNGTALTVTGINRRANKTSHWELTMYLRVYSRNEFHYSFESTKYLYHGLYNERAPEDATEIIFKDGIETIEMYAFWGCDSLSRITMPDTVTRIEDGAFVRCDALRCIQLPPNLQYIGGIPFRNCSLLETLYIPPTVTHVGNGAFINCKSLRIINFPDSIQNIGNAVLSGRCDGLLTDEEKNRSENSHWYRNRYNALHNLCWDPSVTADDIQQYIQQHHNNHERARTDDKPEFTPLHLLAANPSVAGDMISVYLRLAPDVATMQDNIGKTALHMLCSVPYSSDVSGDAIRAYLAFEQGKSAAFIKDRDGRTPLGYLCERGFDEMEFLNNKSFGGLIMWWYDNCLGINFLAEDLWD